MRTSRRAHGAQHGAATTTGTNSEPPCCRPGRESEWGLAQPAGVHATEGPEPSPSCPVLGRTQLAVSVTGSPPPPPGAPGSVLEERDLEPGLGQGAGDLSSPSLRGARTSLQLGREGVASPTESMLLIQPQGLGIWGHWSRTGPEAEGEPLHPKH